MFLFKKTPSFLALSLLWLCMSCSNEESITPELSPLSDVKIENDYLVFSDENHFNKTLNEVGDLSTDELNKFESQKGFFSKRAKIDQAVEYYVKTSFEDFQQSRFRDMLIFQNQTFIDIAFPFLRRAALLNTNGMVKVGSNILVFKNDRVITLHNSDLSYLKNAEAVEFSDREYFLTNEAFSVSKIVKNPLPALDGDNERIADSSGALALCNGPVGPSYLVQVQYASYTTGGAPIIGYHTEAYEIGFRATSQNFGPQYPIYANLIYNISSSNFYFNAGDPAIGDINQNYSNSYSGYNWLVQFTAFTGNAFVQNGGTLNGRVTTTHSFSRNGTVLCSQTNKIVFLP